MIGAPAMWKKQFAISARSSGLGDCVVASGAMTAHAPMRALGKEAVSGTFLGSECADCCFSAIRLENGDPYP